MRRLAQGASRNSCGGFGCDEGDRRLRQVRSDTAAPAARGLDADLDGGLTRAGAEVGGERLVGRDDPDAGRGEAPDLAEGHRAAALDRDPRADLDARRGERAAGGGQARAVVLYGSAYTAVSFVVMAPV